MKTFYAVKLANSEFICNFSEDIAHLHTDPDIDFAATIPQDKKQEVMDLLSKLNIVDYVFVEAH